jgi:predicted RNA-binding protein with PIN domain
MTRKRKQRQYPLYDILSAFHTNHQHPASKPRTVLYFHSSRTYKLFLLNGTMGVPCKNRSYITIATLLFVVLLMVLQESNLLFSAQPEDNMVNTLYAYASGFQERSVVSSYSRHRYSSMFFTQPQIQPPTYRTSSIIDSIATMHESSIRSHVQLIRQQKYIKSSTNLFHWIGNSCSSSSSDIHYENSNGDTVQCRYGWGNCIRRLPSPLDTERIKSRMYRGKTLLFMGKGDGKKRRKKKGETDGGGAATKDTSSLSSPAPSTPLRVSSNVNISVRQQIAVANMNKILRQQSDIQGNSVSSSSSGGASTTTSSNYGTVQPKPRVRTAYRRTWDEEEILQKADERKRRGQEPNWEVILNRTAVDPLLIVDGYNIIYAWPRLKKHMIKGDTGRARQLLVDDLEYLQTLKGWRIECVFDGTKRSTIGPLGRGPGSSSSNTITGMMNPATRGIDQTTKQSVSKYGVRVVYSGVGMEADTYIESRCLRAKNVTNGEITGSLIVATDDAMIRIAGQNGGAVCMSSSRFVDELKAVQKAIAYRVEAAVAKVNGHSIRPEQLRGGISSSSSSANKVVMPSRFGRRSVILEDKRNRTKVSKKNDGIENGYEIDISDIELEEDEYGIPWWAKAPERLNFFTS